MNDAPEIYGKVHFQVTNPQDGEGTGLEVMQITDPRTKRGTADLRVE
jgi:hypothetical protein